MPPRPLSATFEHPRPSLVQHTAPIPKEDPDDRAHLTPAEKAWSSYQNYLEDNGFVLRPRLWRGWRPSWLGTRDDPSKHEDSIRITRPGIVDATRSSDGVRVVLKAMRSPSARDGAVGQPGELGILKYLHSPPYTSHGLAFMHAQNVAHRDLKPSNIMMAGDVLYDEPFHPVAQSLSLDAKSILRPRSRHELDSHRHHDGESAVRYYFVNFSRASYWPPTITADGQSKHALLRSTRGQLGRFPEALLTVGHDPFKADRHLALAPFTSVARYMTRRDPRTRPTAAEAFAHFETIRGSLEAKYLNIPLDSKALYAKLKPPIPVRSPRRAVSTTHLSARASRTPHSHASWSSTDSTRTLVAEISPPIKEVLKAHAPVNQTAYEESAQENKAAEAKKSKGKWGALCNVVKTMVR